MKTLYIIGLGTGSRELVTPLAKKTAEGCDILFATCSAGEGFCGARAVRLDALYESIENAREDRVGVLVSGDAGFFSVSAGLTARFSGSRRVEHINGISCMQYFLGRLGLPYDDVVLCSMHGRSSGLLGKVSYNSKVFVLTGGKNKADTICADLAAQGLGEVAVHIGENLSRENERIVHGKAKELKSQSFGDLAVMLIENPNAPDIHCRLTDDCFIRGDTPMTKEEIRAIVAAKLAVKPHETVYDVGAGTGSVSVVLSRAAGEGRVYAIEKDPDALGLIESNRKKHGAYNLTVIRGQAPEALSALPAPDAVFIGGSGGNLEKILSHLHSISPSARIAATSISLGTLRQLIENPLYSAEICCVNAARAKKIGGQDMMLAQNPVYIALLTSRSAPRGEGTDG